MMVEAKGRTVGGTEYSWCKAIHGGTGIAVLSLLLTKPIEISRFQTSLHKLQNYHPILRSKLHHSTSDTTFSFATSPIPFIKIKSHNLNVTSEILRKNQNDTVSVSPLQQILEHELNINTWQDRNSSDSDMLFVSIYAMSDSTSVVVMRLHVAACDRTTAVSILRELLVLIKDDDDEKTEENGLNEKICLAIEDLVPGRKAKKHIWARGLDMLNYSVNSFRFTNLKFNDTKNARFSQVVRMQLNHNDTKRVLAVIKHFYFMFGFLNLLDCMHVCYNMGIIKVI
jgi:hypothetical protein